MNKGMKCLQCPSLLFFIFVFPSYFSFSFYFLTFSLLVFLFLPYPFPYLHRYLTHSAAPMTLAARPPTVGRRRYRETTSCSPHAHPPQAASVAAVPRHATSSPGGRLHLPLATDLLCAGSSPADRLPGLQLPRRTWRWLALHRTSPLPPPAWMSQICKQCPSVPSPAAAS
jgi:hypothetical protein